MSFQVTVTVGNKGDIQSRDTFEEGLLYFSETTAEIKEHILDEKALMYIDQIILFLYKAESNHVKDGRKKMV